MKLEVSRRVELAAPERPPGDAGEPDKTGAQEQHQRESGRLDEHGVAPHWILVAGVAGAVGAGVALSRLPFR